MEINFNDLLKDSHQLSILICESKENNLKFKVGYSKKFTVNIIDLKNIINLFRKGFDGKITTNNSNNESVFGIERYYSDEIENTNALIRIEYGYNDFVIELKDLEKAVDFLKDDENDEK